MLFLALLADYSQWQFSAWTQDLGFFVFENWWKLLSPEGTRKFPWLVVNSIDFLILITAAGCAVRLRSTRDRANLFPLPALTIVYVLVLGTMFAYGVLSGGDIKAALWQIRPYLHFAAIVLLGSLLIESRSQIITLVWMTGAVVLFKSLQIIWIFFTDAGATFGEWREILGHEDSVFFAGFIGLATAYLLYGIRQEGVTNKQGLWLLFVLPVLVLALALNLRRAGYVALAFIFMLMPLALYGKRKLAVKFALLFFVLGVTYTAVFWDAQGLLGTPAEKLKSIFFAQANSDDHNSNFYRLAENVNLRRTIIRNPLGIGFGQPFELYVPMADISFLLPNWKYHPHNMILGMWMTLGTIGFAFFIFYHASIMTLAAYHVRRTMDHQLRAIGFFALATYAAGFLVASVDQFIWSERGAIFMALLAAITIAIGRLRKVETQDHARN
jgi:O-antigen ligase